MRVWKFFVPLLAPCLCLAQADRVAGKIDASQMVALPGHVHPKAQPQYDQGPVEPTLAFGYVTLSIAPSPSQQTALNQLLAQQQDRRSPNFHKWLTPEQYAERFGLSPNDVTQITAWLESEGFSIVSVARGRNAVVFSGIAAQIESAFRTQIDRYDVNGEKHIANSAPISVPAALSGIITDVRGLNDFRWKPMYVRPAGYGRALAPHPSYTTTIEGQAAYILAPGDIATLYDLGPFYSASPAIDGTGQKLAIIGQTDVYLADIADFRSGFGLPTFTCTTGSTGLITSCDTTNFQYVLVGTDEPVSLGDLTESDLDLEWSGAVARNAQIIFVNAPVNSAGTSGGVDVALSYAIDNIVAPVVSMSYGACEYFGGTNESELQQANSQGMTIMTSAGDQGAASCDYSPPGTTSTSTPNPPYAAADYGYAVNYPASSPEVTGVGGTSIPSNELNTTYWGSNGTSTTNYGASANTNLIGTEVAWNDDAALAALCVSQPSNAFCNPSPGVKVTSAETYQQDYWIAIGGGGVSNCYNPSGAFECVSGFARPAWQTVSIPGQTSPQSTYRLVPDVSLLASPNFPGYIICTPVEELSDISPYDTETSSSCANGIATAADGTFSNSETLINPSIVGGTSASSPVFAGMMALLNQYLNTSGLGNINSTLYTLATTTPSAFHKVTSGENNVYCDGNTPSGAPSDVLCPTTGANAGIVGFEASSADATTGYNLVSGLGSVDANNLAVAWKATLVPDFQLSAGTLLPTPVSAGNSTNTTLTIAPIAGSTGMVVNFSNTSSCSGLPTGATCSFNPTSVTFTGTNSPTTTLTISTLANVAASGPTTITVTPSNSPNTTATVSLTVTATTESFSLTATNGTTFPIAAGGTATVDIAVSSLNGFVNNNTTGVPLTYTCSGIPATAEISCSLPNSGQPDSATTVTLGLVTTGVVTQLRPKVRDRRLFYAMLLPGLFGIVFAAGSGKRGVRLLSLLVVLGCSTLWLGACGGSGNNTSLQNPGTPVGQYTVTINATTGGANPLTSSLTVTLNVTQ